MIDPAIPDGIHTVVVTPFNPDGTINHTGLAAHVDWLISEGVHAMMPGGTTGEYYAQTTDERKAVLDTVVTAVGGRVPLLAGCNSVRPEETIELGVYARSIGYGAIMLAAPFYSLPSEDDMVEHYRRIGGEVGLPIMLYNFPARTGVDMTPAFLDKALAAVPEIKAIKESSGSIVRMHELVFDFGDRLQTICGADDQAVEYFLWGVTAFVAGASNFLPAAHVALYETCVVKQDLLAGRELMRAMMPMFTLLEQGGKYIQYCKYGTERRGFPTGGVRGPISDLSAAERATFDRLFDEIAALGT